MSDSRLPFRPTILVVEDNLSDQVLVQDALSTPADAYDLQMTRDGAEAMRYLRRADVTRPALVLLDLNLPRKSGAEVLAEIRSDPRLRSIPIVVMTSAPADREHLDPPLPAEGPRANELFEKPSNYEAFQRAVRGATRWIRPTEAEREPTP